MVGPLNWLLWKMYNALTDRNGLDSVRNLVINFVLFVLIGASIGIGIGLWQRRSATGVDAHCSIGRSIEISGQQRGKGLGVRRRPRSDGAADAIVQGGNRNGGHPLRLIHIRPRRGGVPFSRLPT